MVDRYAELLAETATIRSELRDFRHAMELRFSEMEGRLQVQIAELRADTRDWMLKFFVPLWIGIYGTIAAVVVTNILRN